MAAFSFVWDTGSLDSRIVFTPVRPLATPGTPLASGRFV